jgi:glycosyltransferase involved in cell wall biosynthesis
MTNEKLGIVIAIRNEVENIIQLLHELIDALDKNYEYEIVIVDDNSHDDSVQKINSVFYENEKIIVLTLNKNFGQTIALRCGINYIKNRVDIVVTMDGDGQDNPYEIEKLLGPIIYENYDVVVGWRVNRSDAWHKRALSKLANNLIKGVFKSPINDQGSPLKAFKPQIFQELPEMQDQHRYIPLLSGIIGANIKEVPVVHRPRKYGKSKYTLSKTLKVILDLPFIYLIIKSRRNIPRISTAFSFIIFLTAIIIQIELLIKKIFYDESILEKVSFYFSLNLVTTSFLIFIVILMLKTNNDFNVVYKKINE